MPITIQEIIASDTISQFVDKTNFNFDQLLLNGGGPGGPTGPKGPTGPGGGRGPKGSTWYEDIATSSPGNSPNTVSPTATPFDKDYYLQFNGEVWEYNGTLAIWEITTIDLQGPPGTAGGGGGFGLTIGSPVINQSNIRYNGPIGLNNGANNINEGVPSVLIGGVTSLTTALPGINFTGAYIVPDTIITGNSSYLTSLLIHQKDSQSRGIVFHGGAAIGSGDNFEQSDPSQLSNIRLDVDDTLELSVPKAPTSPSTQSQMLGLRLFTPSRAQQFFAGSDISIQSGTGPATPDFGSQHSNIEINVGEGGSGGDGNLFRAVTQGSISRTLLEAGNTTQIALVTNQALQTGNWQVQAGEIRMVSSTTKNLGLYSGGDLRLNTLDSGGSSTGTGSIILSAGVGGINLNSTNLGNLNGSAWDIGFTATNTIVSSATDNHDLRTVVGNLNITQLDTNTSGGATTSGKNIEITANASSKTGTSPGLQTVGQIRIANKTNIILGKGGTTNYQQFPSIIIDQDYYDTDPTKVQPHTRFTGKQTWQYAKSSNTTIVYSSQSSAYQYNHLDGLVGAEVFRQTGDVNFTSIGTGASMEMWRAGVVNSGGVNDGIMSGVIQIRQGSELTQYATDIQGTVWDYGAGTTLAYDSTLSLTIRDDFYTTAQSNDKQYFSVNTNKTAIGNPLILNRTQYQSTLGNIAPSASSTMDVEAGVSAMTANYPSWGFDYRSEVTPFSDTPSTLGMPTTGDLTSPLITLKFGIGVGQLSGIARGGSGSSTLNFETAPGVGVDNSFEFPLGMYPGQRITLIVECYAIRGAVGTIFNPPVTPIVWFGAIRINIPANRSSATLQGLQTQDWYYDGGVDTDDQYGNAVTYPSTNQRRNFYQSLNLTRGVTGGISDQASNCITTTKQIEMIWDGTVTKTWGSTVLFNPPTTPGSSFTPMNLLGTVYTQAGWRVLSDTLIKTGEGQYGRNTWVVFP